MNVNVTIVKEITIAIPDEITDDCEKICDYVEEKTGLHCGSGVDYANEKPTISNIVAQNAYIPYFEW